MRTILLTVLCLHMASSMRAQVYTFSPKYKESTIYNETSGEWINEVDTAWSHECTIDLTRKYLAMMQDTIPITGVSKDGQAHTFTLDTEPGKHTRLCTFTLRTNADGAPKYLRKINVRSDRGFRRDTFIEVYTSYPGAFTYHMRCHRMKRKTGFDNISAGSMNYALMDAPYQDAYNEFELRDGIVYWTEGVGDTARRHVLAVQTEGGYASRPKSVLLLCKEGDKLYSVVYTDGMVTLEPNQSGEVRFIAVGELDDRMHIRAYAEYQ